ncbi:ABC transporter ATP-binding protein [Roseateles sp.]|uniref:ABC transporter ATP-binding protein n=1 Tax=Roseateles sp. TaxID=1971397 RepID=UPI0037C755EA
MADVKLQGVSKAYGATRILHGIDLDIRDGEFMVFVGPSGCGKSTLLRTIAGLEDITGGEMRIGGVLVNEVPPAERGIAMVFQSYALYPHMNLYDNMAFGLKLAKVPPAEIDAAVRHAARILHIEHLLERKPKDLSGGQRQRVAIGRAIVRKPEVFLFDEPLSNLDAALRVRMRYEFAKLHEELKTTMVYVTHDQVEAMTLADRIVVLQAGRIEQVGTPLELYEHPANLFVAGFIGSPKMNFIEAELVETLAQPPAQRSGDDSTCTSTQQALLRLRDGSLLYAFVDASRAKVGDKVTLGVRPEHIRLGGDVNTVSSKVSFVECLGSATFAYCNFPGTDEPLTCQFEGRNGHDRVRSGDALQLHIPPEAAYVFDAQGQAMRRLAAPELVA